MYHIWAVQCQIQLGTGKCFDHQGFAYFSALISAQGGSQLALAVACGLRGMDQSENIVPADRGLDLGKAADYGAGLRGDGQRIEGRPFDQLFGLRGQIGGNADVPPEAAREDVMPNCIFDRFGLDQVSSPRAAGRMRFLSARSTAQSRLLHQRIGHPLKFLHAFDVARP